MPPFFLNKIWDYIHRTTLYPVISIKNVNMASTTMVSGFEINDIEGIPFKQQYNPAVSEEFYSDEFEHLNKETFELLEPTPKQPNDDVTFGVAVVVRILGISDVSHVFDSPVESLVKTQKLTILQVLVSID